MMPQLWAPPRKILRPGKDFDIGLPRNGLVGLYDPYRDAYGRNVLPTLMTSWTGGAAVTASQDDPYGGKTAYLLTDANEGTNVTVFTQPAVSKTTVRPSMLVKAGTAAKTRIEASFDNGTDIGIACVITWGETPSAVFSAVGGHATTGASFVAEPGCAGWYRLDFGPITDNPANNNSVLTIGINPAGWISGGSTTGTVYVCREQLNLGSTLFPYSPPVGAPGTLQTATDYSGRGNNLTLGATTGASTDDPVNTGTAWRFDGGDFLGSAFKPTLTAGLTVLVVRKATGATAWNQWLNTGGAASDKGFYLAQNATAPFFKANDGSASVTATLSAGNAPDGAWIILAGQIDVNAGKVRLYNNALTANEQNLGSLNLTNVGNSTTSIICGKGSDGSFVQAGGELALVCVWQRALSLRELTRAYRYIKSLFAGRGVTLA